MRIAHIIDPLIGVIPEGYLTAGRDEQWQQDRLRAFGQVCASAVEHGAAAILITGRLFAENYVTDAVITKALEIIRKQPCPLVWLPDETGLRHLRHKEDVPKNLFLMDTAGKAEFILDDACIFAWSEAPRPSERSNILIFDESLPAESVIRAARTLFPDLCYAVSGDKAYIYENGGFRAERLARYENIGFDDHGRSGYYLLKFENKLLRRRDKVETGIYGFKTLRIEVEAGDDLQSVYKKCERAAADFTQRDFVRIILNGFVDEDSFIRTEHLRESLKDRFFYLEVFNNCKLELDEGAYSGDISLGSEFVRCVLADDTLSEAEKSRVIQCGRNALRGKELSE